MAVMATRIGMIAALALAVAAVSAGVSVARAAAPAPAAGAPVSSWSVPGHGVTAEPSPGGIDEALAQAAQAYYRNPLREVRRLLPDRIDEGVDYGGSGPVKALGRATVTVVDRGDSNFWTNVGGNVVVERLDAGPLLGLSVYIAENCTPSPSLRVGELVTAASTLCVLHNRFPYLETGFAQPGRGGIPAAWPVYEHVPDGSQTAYGLDFSRLLEELGAPGGNTARDVSYRHWRTVGTLPPGFPQF